MNTAIEQMLEIESIKQENVVTGESLGVGMARLGQPTQKVRPIGSVDVIF